MRVARLPPVLDCSATRCALLRPSGNPVVSRRKGSKKCLPVLSTALDREHFILSHMPQVRLIATRMHRHCPRQVELDDLISAGVVGLIQAVDQFNPERCCKLKTLAEHRIRAERSSIISVSSIPYRGRCGSLFGNATKLVRVLSANLAVCRNRPKSPKRWRFPSSAITAWNGSLALRKASA
jgi:hypothetical protein